MFTSAAMSLTVWNLLTDLFDHTQLANNFTAIDAHDHTSGKGVQIPTGGLANGAVTTAKIATGAVTAAVIAANTITASQIANNTITSTQLATSATALALSATAPGSPSDGQPWFYNADSTNGVTWQFRYHAGSASSYKWEFVGGGPLIGTPFTLALAGDYEIYASNTFEQLGTTNNSSGQVYVSVNGGNTAPGTAAFQGSDTGANTKNVSVTVGVPMRLNALAAASVVAIASSLVGSMTTNPAGQLSIRPIRVS